MNPEQLTLFLQISAWLTGFEEVELQGTGMVDTYFKKACDENTAENVGYFFAEVAFILTSTEDQPEQTTALIQSRLMPNSSYNNMAKQITLMWYTGQWFADPAGNPQDSVQINAQSYVQGLMWTAAQTHPPGAKQPGYGSWAEQPITIPSI